MPRGGCDPADFKGPASIFHVWSEGTGTVSGRTEKKQGLTCQAVGLLVFL